MAGQVAGTGTPLAPEREPLTLDEYRLLVKVQTCRWCKTPLPLDVERHDHPYGWIVKGFAVKQWLYLTCPNIECGYQWALWKLGVPRQQEAANG
jgi:hypothetical protein